MKKYFLVTLFALLYSTLSLLSQEPERSLKVAVLDFKLPPELKNGDLKPLAVLCETQLREWFGEKKGFKTLERQDIEKIINEYQLSKSSFAKNPIRCGRK